MAIVVEDGSIVTGANSYVTEAELIAYAALRGVTIASSDAEKWITLAMDYLETLDYKGEISTSDQPLQWPRLYVKIDGYSVISTEIPDELKKVEMHLATQISQGVDPTSNVERATKREKVGDLEVEYMAGTSYTTVDRKLSMLLNKLLVGGSSSGFRVYKA